ncbi:RWD-domain-containing protein [Plenodomus tracheiphilus IPT5]|uniref:RWD-domain-containing protein n=1 Tax=Plenodomus tracheiphilus IPT5 TaxID=1408161 RepID=A0A6A7BL89_9PLEO|nr:RWD-domain-containing protein [Plenodomus tracheiphilus IPT5]
MGLEDQQEEREVLESIFPEEITYVSDTEFRVLVQLDDGRHEDEERDDEQPQIILNVQYPPSYPDEPPNLDITQPPNTPKHAYLDLQTDKPHLLSSLTSTIDENLGMPMIFTLVTTLKETAESLITSRQNAQEVAANMEALRLEEAENKKFMGEAVTRESFLKWREEFRREREEEARRLAEEKEVEDKKKRVVKEERKLTGKELWQQGLVGKVEESEDEDEGVDLEKLKVGEVV